LVEKGNLADATTAATGFILTGGNMHPVAGGVHLVDIVWQFTNPITVRVEGWLLNLVVQFQGILSQVGFLSVE